MRNFLILVFDREDRIVGVDHIRAESIEEAAEHGAVYAAILHDVVGFEVWENGQKVYSHTP